MSRKPLKFLQPYIDARWGIKNHWYPALFSHEVKEDEVKGVQIAGGTHCPAPRKWQDLRIAG